MKQRQWLTQLGLVCSVCSLLAACSQMEEVPFYGPCTLAPKRATSRPYTIKGICYYPQPHYEYEECGIASYYGGGDIFHGRPTSTGETFDMNGITAAHKTLPLPCIVEVVNLENGRQMTVRVNDRGPFIQGRIIDVSRRVAQLLGFEGKGTAQVRVRTLVPESLALNGITTTPVMAPSAPCPTLASVVSTPETATVAAAIPAATQAQASFSSPKPEETLAKAMSSPKTSHTVSPGIFVDVGGYATPAQAEQISHALEQAGLSTHSIEKGGNSPYVVRVGPFPNMSEANYILDQVGATGHTSRLIIVRP